MKDKQWLRVALPVFGVAWGGNGFTPMLVYYRGQGVLAAVVVDLMLVYYAIGVAIGLLATGSLSDRYGRRALMLPAPIVALLGSALIASGEHTAWLMGLGRFCAGTAVGMAMTAGGSWIKELSSPRFDPSAAPSSGAMRVAMSLSAGFGLGAGASGLIGQWAPLPGQLPFVFHILLTLAFQPLLFGVQETRQSPRLGLGNYGRSGIFPLRAVFSFRFIFLAAAVAPWVFGTAFVGNAILPQRFQPEMEHPIALTGMFITIVLITGFVVQRGMPLVPAHLRPALSLGAVVLSMSTAVYVVEHLSLVWVTCACVLLGISYGSCMYTGLSETIEVAAPNELGSLSGVYYSLTYTGMIFPAVLTALSGRFGYPQMLGFGAAVAVVLLLLAVWASRRVYGAGRG
ncbi:MULTISPECIES: MFS transporter [Corynebacterium]|uniref:MFS transporter n=1 Tax=Corynebacterium TaxID=1716 RepID=UPI001CEF89A4|nr:MULTISPECIES: MFS transporter [Corynebacterium]